MSGSQPRAGGPSRRRTFAPAEKLQHLAAYDEACRDGQGGAYLRRAGAVFLAGHRVAQAARRRRPGGPPGGGEGRPAERGAGRDRPAPRCSWTRRSGGWPGPRWRWTSWEKHTRSWRRSPRARRTSRRHAALMAAYRALTAAGCDDPRRGRADRRRPRHRRSARGQDHGGAAIAVTAAGAGQPAHRRRAGRGAGGAQQCRVRRPHPAADLCRAARSRPVSVFGVEHVSGAGRATPKSTTGAGWPGIRPGSARS